MPTPAGTAEVVILTAGKEVFTLTGTLEEVLDAGTAEGKRLAGEGASSVMRVTVGEDTVAQGEFIAIDSAPDQTVQ